jgi:transcriptional regulator with XRE-family HTH domain
MKQEIVDRFHSKIDKRSDPDGCWLWIAAINWDGFGTTHINRKTVMAHRLSYCIYNELESIPEGKIVNHTCKNNHCVNPEHLVLGDRPRHRGESIQVRLKQKRVIDRETDCWNWIGGVTSAGYGSIGYHGKIWQAHRLSYEVFKEPVPKEKLIRHKCDNKLCINPDHLEIGTHQDNSRDYFERILNKKVKEHFNTGVRTNEAIAETIISMRQDGCFSREIADVVGLSIGTVERILRAKGVSRPDKVIERNKQVRKGLLAGENNPRCKLTDEQVEEIRKIWEARAMTQGAIAKLYGVSRATVGLIATGKHRNTNKDG